MSYFEGFVLAVPAAAQPRPMSAVDLIDVPRLSDPEL